MTNRSRSIRMFGQRSKQEENSSNNSTRSDKSGFSQGKYDKNDRNYSNEKDQPTKHKSHIPFERLTLMRLLYSIVFTIIVAILIFMFQPSYFYDTDDTGMWIQDHVSWESSLCVGLLAGCVFFVIPIVLYN